MDNWNENQNLSAAAYESAVEIKSKCEALEKMLEPLNKFCNETYPTILNVLESMKDDIAEVDVYDEFKALGEHLESIEDCAAFIIDGCIPEASMGAQKVIEELS